MTGKAYQANRSLVSDTLTPTLTVKNINASGISLLIEDAEGDDFIRVGRNTGNDAIIINPSGATPIPTGSALQIIHTAPAAAAGYVLMDSTLDSVATGAQDAGAVRGITRQLGGSVGALIRGGEFHALRATGVPSAGTWGIEVSCQPQVAGNGSSLIGAIYAYCDDAFFGSGGVRGDFGLLTTGAKGFEFPIICFDTDGSTRLFTVDKTGVVTSNGNILPRVTDLRSLGNGTFNWLGVYATFHLATTVTSHTQPAITASYDTNTGLFFPGGDIIGFGVGAAEVGRWIASGLQVEASAILKQIATPSAPSAGYTSLYGKSGGGIFSRANGGSEKQHKAGGQLGFAVGSTANPTTTFGSYADIAEMSVTLTTTGGDLVVTLNGSFSVGTASTSYVLALSLDGAAEVATRSLTQGSANFLNTVTVNHRFTGVSAASHIVKGRWLVAGGAMLTAFSIERSLTVVEMPT